MNDLISDGLQFKSGKLYLLDQTLLPLDEKWIECANPEITFKAIQELKVRGAPLIGVAASLFVGQYASQIRDKEKISACIDYLVSSRPTAVNLQALLEQHRDLLNDQMDFEEHLRLAIRHFEEDVQLCERIGAHGADLVKDHSRVLTHCNAGSLATVGSGTALSVIKKAAETKKNIHVYVDETRPLLQGARLTAWEMMRSNISHEIICDNMAASLMQAKKIDLIITGADRICANGDFANKIGTYNLAVLARFHDIPFYVAAPYTTVDKNCSTGLEIPIEQRAPQEVRGVKLRGQLIQWCSPESSCYNPAFDVTPADLVTGYVLDSGYFSSSDFAPAKTASL